MEQKHSGLGISSFVLSILVGILMFACFVAAGVMAASSPGGIDENSAGAIVVGLFMLALCGLDILAVGLGIAGLLQKDRKKVLSILGIIFGAATLLVTIALVVLGNSM